MTRRPRKLYVSRIIEAAGCPQLLLFIESPMGIEPRTIPACCYSTELTRNADPTGSTLSTPIWATTAVWPIRTLTSI